MSENERVLDKTRRSGIGRLTIVRKPRQGFTIGDDILVEVRAVDGNRITVTVSAPRNMLIRRIERDERTALSNSPRP